MEYKWEVTLSVKDLIFMMHSGGDLNFQTSTYGRNRAQEGIVLHQLLQSQRGESYQKEYFLKQDFEVAGGKVTLKGRADGIDLGQKPAIVEEIKSYVGDFKDIADIQRLLHKEQLYVYGYLFLTEFFEEDALELQLTYIHADTEKVEQETEVCTRSFLKQHFAALFSRFETYLIRKIERKEQRNLLLQKQSFPLGEFRTGQRDLSACTYRALRDKKNYFIEAPTGTGKTIGNLFPAFKAMGEGHLDQIFFLTAKNTGKETARKSFEYMANENSMIKSVEISSKSSICFNTDLACDPAECKFAKGYFDRIEEAKQEIDNSHQFWGKAEIETVAAKHTVCPFEMSLDLIYDADVVVCDYNYVFDPKVYLRRCFEHENKQTVVLIDEAHNLISRARAMFSTVLSEYDLTESKKKWANESPRLKKSYNAVLKQLRELRKELDDVATTFYFVKEGPKKLANALHGLTSQIDRWLGDNQDHLFKNELLEEYFGYKDFLRIWDLYDSHYTTLIELDYKKINVKLLCLDVAPQVEATTKKIGGTVFFSATMTPVGFYKTAYLGNSEVDNRQFPSPFPKENSQVLIPTYISTKYKNRNHSLDNLCGAILTVVEAKQGNYMIFCPSYSYLELVHNRLHEFLVNSDLNVDVISQSSDMSTEERENFIAKFKVERKEGLIGFVVSGGVFGEGIDLVHEQLIGAIIVGVGLPGISEENNAISAYYKDKFNKGYEFAYQYPGINQVLQNAGRVIRTVSDKGIICLIDDRYLSYAYSVHFPRHWNVKYASNPKQLRQEVNAFWESVE